MIMPYECQTCHQIHSSNEKEGIKWLVEHAVSHHPEEVENILHQYHRMEEIVNDMFIATSRVALATVVPQTKFVHQLVDRVNTLQSAAEVEIREQVAEEEALAASAAAFLVEQNQEHAGELIAEMRKEDDLSRGSTQDS